MSKQIRKGGEPVRQFVLKNVANHPDDVVSLTAAKFDITPQAVQRHVREMIEAGSLVKMGTNRRPTYMLVSGDPVAFSQPLGPDLDESLVWEQKVLPHLANLPKNVVELWEYAVTELVNNAKDHSGGTTVYIRIVRDAATTRIGIADDGMGVFAKLQQALDLPDQRMAALELAKGKLTTDPSNHSGEGIFFSTRMTDSFSLRSGSHSYQYRSGSGFDWVNEQEPMKLLGTIAGLSVDNHTARSRRKVFAQYQSSDGDLRFNKTVVPVALAKIGQADLISRSQGKRLMARLDRFEVVELDFAGIEDIGQGFADEVFRVYVNAHPEMQVLHKNANKQVLSMIGHVDNAPA